MREILFRGKRVDNGEWVYGSYLRRTHPCIEFFYFAEDGVPEPDIAEVVPETVGQYVGFKDEKTGTKIFEGDIVKTSTKISANGVFYPYLDRNIVEINDGCFSLRVIKEKGQENKNGVSYYIHGVFNHYEILGNIYDNPELTAR